MAVTTVSPDRNGILFPEPAPEEGHAGKESGAELDEPPLPEDELEAPFEDPAPNAPASLFKSFDL